VFILYSKAFHVIGMVAWFAAIFFLGRIYIYHKEAIENKEKNIISLCEGAEKRLLYIILLPSAIITTVFGFILVYYLNAFNQGWFHIKFTFVILFFIYNHYLIKIRKKFLNNSSTPSAASLRLLNEIPFILLIIIVMTVYLKSLLDIKILLVVLISFGLFYFFYKLKNKKANKIN
tara:strand:+ start:861 stop:1385 length:525 start_codon:yes stop_codon:yes gene_type:complete